MHSNQNSHSTLHLPRSQLYSVDDLVQTGCGDARSRHRELLVVCHAAHSQAISHDLQLFLDVLRGRSPALSARCGFY